MLVKPDYSRRSLVRPSRSIHQEYAEYIQQRVEDHKNQLSRERLMALADEVVGAMDPGNDGQLSLTEMLVSDRVDQLIAKNLSLPRFAKWKKSYVARRLAQRQITHWKTIHPNCPLGDLVLYLEPTDHVLLVGKGCAEHAYFVAAHDSGVTFIAGDVKSVDAAEHRASAESLSPQLTAYAVDLGGAWFPEVSPSLVLVDALDLLALGRDTRELAVERLKELTLPGGTHHVFASQSDDRESFDIEMSHIRSLYSPWGVRSGMQTGAGILATRPA
jgi:hypothetical protein